MQRIALLLAFLVLPLCSPNIWAQEQAAEPARLGIFGNIDFALSGGSFTGLPTIANCCPEFTSASDMGFLMGLTYIKPLDATWDLHVRLHYSQYGAPFSETETLPIVDLQGGPSSAVIRHDLNANFQQISVEPLLGYALSRDLSLLGGITAGFVISSTFDQVEVLTEPEDGRFSNDSRQRNAVSGDIPNAASLALGLTLGASYDLALNEDRTLFLSPEILATVSPFAVASDVDWTIQHLRAGIAFSVVPPALEDSLSDEELYDFASNVEPPSRVSPGVPFVSSVSAVAVDANGNESPLTQVRIDEYESYHERPLLPYVFFDQNSFVLPKRYYAINSSSKESFSTDNFFNLDEIITYRHVLNIIGYRMSNEPDATISLKGHATPDERGGNDLSLERAKAVRSYLSEVWDIAPSRIAVEGVGLPENASNNEREDGRVENRRVEISASSASILAPIASTDTARITSPEGIRFRPSINPNVKVRLWTLFLANENGMYKAINGSSPVPQSVDYVPTGTLSGIPMGTKELNYLLAVTDTSGAVVPSKTGTVPVVENRLVDKERMGTSAQLDRFSMILFGFDDASITPAHETAIASVKSKITPRSKVTVAGHTDRSGSPDYNKTLSERRAKAVAAKLDGKATTVVGYGEHLAPYDNSTPEGRFYNRTVEVTVETPKN